MANKKDPKNPATAEVQNSAPEAVNNMIGEAFQEKVPFAVIEAYKNIRTNLLSIITEQKKKAICFTSPNAAEGKSTSSINIAIAISQLNKKVILIDADAHRSTVHSKLKIKNEAGCLNVLTGESSWRELLQSRNPHLDILTAGSSTSNPSELFSSEAFDRLLAELKEEYDYVIVDTPPVNVVSDSLIISQKCDASVLIVRSDFTTHRSLKNAISSLKVLKINILGVILNGVGAQGKKYYKYSKYSKYSSYRY